MPHRKNTRTGKPLPHNEEEKKKILLEEQRLRGGPDVAKPELGRTKRPGVFTFEEGERTFVGLSPEDVELLKQQQGQERAVQKTVSAPASRLRDKPGLIGLEPKVTPQVVQEELAPVTQEPITEQTGFFQQNLDENFTNALAQEGKVPTGLETQAEKFNFLVSKGIEEQGGAAGVALSVTGVGKLPITVVKGVASIGGLVVDLFRIGFKKRKLAKIRKELQKAKEVLQAGEEITEKTVKELSPAAQKVYFETVKRMGGNPVISATAIKAVRAATAWNNAKSYAGWAVGSFAAFELGKKVISIGTQKIEDQTQALNTLGTITSTIVGDSTSGVGDWREGLRQLDVIEADLRQLESDIKRGLIGEENARIKISGELIDINADIFDQLATIQEGRNDIRSFAAQGLFPEVSDFEMQSIIRQLEDDGIIEPAFFEQITLPSGEEVGIRRETSEEETGLTGLI